MVSLADLQAQLPDFLNQVAQAETLDQINEVRVALLGKKGTITEALKTIKDVPVAEKKDFGQGVNLIKVEVNKALDDKSEAMQEEAYEAEIASQKIDVTLPGRQVKKGNRHVINQVIEEIENLFLTMGYEIIEGTEIETDFYNFERMNIPKDHPARDMQDSFYIDGDYLLRTHTSPVQAHTMDNHDFSNGALKMISPGKVFRRDDDDATHSHQFHQIEGLVVDKNVTLADLQGTLLAFSRAMFGEEREVRMRPSFFPFTEPSVELDISCFKCGGEGCNICKHTGWIEILGGGVVHPDVLSMSGIDAEEYTGFAFGLGPDRVAMLKYGIDDIRHFYHNDRRFLDQFNREEL